MPHKERSKPSASNQFAHLVAVIDLGVRKRKKKSPPLTSPPSHSRGHRGCGSFSRDARLALSIRPALSLWPYAHRRLQAVHCTYSVPAAPSAVTAQGTHKGGMGSTHDPPKHCAGLPATTRVPTPAWACIIGPVRINHARQEGKKGRRAKQQEKRHPTR